MRLSRFQIKGSRVLAYLSSSAYSIAKVRIFSAHSVSTPVQFWQYVKNPKLLKKKITPILTTVTIVLGYLNINGRHLSGTVPSHTKFHKIHLSSSQLTWRKLSFHSLNGVFKFADKGVQRHFSQQRFLQLQLQSDNESFELESCCQESSIKHVYVQLQGYKYLR